MTAATPAQLNAAAEIEALDNPGITKFYLAVRREFRELLKRARRISRGSGGISSTGNRMYWGCVLFTRIVVTAKSLDQLLPDPKPGEHWDFSAAASLTRNLFEACLVYHWLCGEDVPETLSIYRLWLDRRCGRDDQPRCDRAEPADGTTGREEQASPARTRLCRTHSLAPTHHQGGGYGSAHRARTCRSSGDQDWRAQDHPISPLTYRAGHG